MPQYIPPHVRDLGGFTVRRMLPQGARRSVGPFVFLDHIGPAEIAPGAGMEVRPRGAASMASMP